MRRGQAGRLKIENIVDKFGLIAYNLNQEL